MKMKVSTFFALFAEFGTAQIPLDACCEKYFGISSAEKAKQRAAQHNLPVPAYRCGSQKSQWFINAQDLADLIDHQHEQAKKDHAAIQAA